MDLSRFPTIYEQDFIVDTEGEELFEGAMQAVMAETMEDVIQGWTGQYQMIPEEAAAFRDYVEHLNPRMPSLANTPMEPEKPGGEGDA